MGVTNAYILDGIKLMEFFQEKQNTPTKLNQ
jgi:hypothetical protein